MFASLPLPDGLGLRMAQASDQPFITRLFRSTRQHFFMADVEPDLLETVIEQQCEFQIQGYGNQTPNAYTFIVEKQAEPIGRVMIDFSINTAHIVDISLVPEVRGKGYASAILGALQDVATRQGVPVTLFVDRNNPTAKKVYTNLGFAVEGGDDTQEFMVWYPMRMAQS